MLSKNHSISVIIPVFNSERYLKKAIDSILNQSFPDFEIIAVNDGSTDNSFNILSDLTDSRIRIIDNLENIGMVATRNKGISHSKGKYIALFDNDDISHPDRLKIEYDFLESHPEIGVVGSWARYIDEEGNPFGEWRMPVNNEDIFASFLKFNPVINTSTFFRKSIFDDVGQLRGVAGVDDYEFWLRVAEKYKFHNIPMALVDYRIHNKQLSLTKLSQQVKDANSLKVEYSQRWIDLKLLPQNYIPATPTLFDRLTGASGTVAEACLYWAWLYKSMGQNRTALKLALQAIVSAPLSSSAFRTLFGYLYVEILPKKIRSALSWYFFKIKSVFINRYS